MICCRCEQALLSCQTGELLDRGGFSVYIWGVYCGELRLALEALKYGGEPRLGDWLGERLGRWWLEEGWPRSGWSVTAVPLHSERRRQRGFNQAEQIARAFARRTGLRYLELLGRDRPTVPLHGLTPRDRARALTDAFHCTRPLAGASVLIVDDIFTTGTTMALCAKTLHSAGCVRVSGLVVAHPIFGKTSKTDT